MTAPQAGSDECVLEHAQVREHGRRLLRADDAVLGAVALRQLEELLPTELQRPSVGVELARDHLERCRFSGAVGTDQRVHGSRRQLELEPIERLEASEPLREAAHRERARFDLPSSPGVRGEPAHGSRIRRHQEPASGISPAPPRSRTTSIP